MGLWYNFEEFIIAFWNVYPAWHTQCSADVIISTQLVAQKCYSKFEKCLVLSVHQCYSFYFLFLSRSNSYLCSRHACLNDSCHSWTKCFWAYFQNFWYNTRKTGCQTAICLVLPCSVHFTHAGNHISNLQSSRSKHSFTCLFLFEIVSSLCVTYFFRVAPNYRHW